MRALADAVYIVVHAIVINLRDLPLIQVHLLTVLINYFLHLCQVIWRDCSGKPKQTLPGYAIRRVSQETDKIAYLALLLWR